MRNVLNTILAFLFACGTSIALAAADEGGKLAPEPTVSVGWVYFFIVVFFGICAWFGYAIWNAEKKNRAAASNQQS
jgi:protein-S-isoprenylcysteine O-methyltransferase Ste14